MDLKLTIYTSGTIYEAEALCQGEITLTSERKGSPASLTFKIARDIVSGKGISFTLGDRVELRVNGNGIFKGFIFAKSRTKEQIITVTAYDQLRYLTNTKFYHYHNKRADEVVRMIAEDFKLTVGELDNTVYVIDERREDGQSLFDIILDAVDLTNIYTGNLHTFYDDFGELTLKHIENMRLPFMFVTDDLSIIDYTYKTDIDRDSYNTVTLYKDDKETGVRSLYTAKDGLNQAKWGILQYYEAALEHFSEAQTIETAERILKIKNRPLESLSIECLSLGNGEEKIRGGSGIIVKIDDIGETSVNSWFMVNKVIHTFKNNEHTMKIYLEEATGK